MTGLSAPSGLSDTSTWLPLDGLAPGFDANKAPTVADLHDRSFVLRCDDGSTLSVRFSGTGIDWSHHASGTDESETFLVDDGLYYVQFHPSDGPEQAYTVFLDLREGRGLVVLSRIGDTSPRVAQTFLTATIEGIDARGDVPAPTTSLVGRRALWVYSAAHAYEHVYLSPHWYTWQCLAGPEKGLADTDENTTYRLRPGIFVFTWREKVIPCGSVTVADHRDTRRLRSHGVLFGLDGTGEVPTHFTFGAHGRLLSTTVHPAEYDPADE